MSERFVAVTGAAGFIGWNLVRALATEPGVRVIAVDDLTLGGDPAHLQEPVIADVLSPEQFLQRLNGGSLPALEGVLHQGAITDTECDDEALLQRANIDFTVRLARLAHGCRLPFVYASSASVYGTQRENSETAGLETPLNPYAVSKARIDTQLRQLLQPAGTPRSTLVGLRYFNVYGPGEGHKGAMASIVRQAHDQIRATGVVKLFMGEHDEPMGSQVRDWVHVDDVVRVNLHFLRAEPVRGVYNVGCATPRTFADIAEAVMSTMGTGRVHGVPFPPHLRGRYQSYTCADITALRAAGYSAPFIAPEAAAGVPRYVRHLLETA